jgi:hypothetical protein
MRWLRFRRNPELKAAQKISVSVDPPLLIEVQGGRLPEHPAESERLDRKSRRELKRTRLFSG